MRQMSITAVEHGPSHTDKLSRLSKMKFAGIVLFLAALGLAGCVTTESAVGERTLSVISGAAGSERPDYQRIESTLAGLTSIFTAHGWENYPQPVAYHITGGHIYHINFARGGFGCFAEMDQKSSAFRFFELESSPRSGIFPGTDEQRAQVRVLARDIDAYLRRVLPKSYEIRLSES